MNTNDFVDATAADDLYVALEPFAPPRGTTGACAEHVPARFDSLRRQQLTFDGDPVDAEADYPAARAICLECPMLDACRRYANNSRDRYTFLAGLTGEQRAAQRTKRSEIVKRRLQAMRLDELGAPTAVIAELVGRDQSLIRHDLRAVRRQVRSAA
jgi:hypothetical protein